MKPGEQGLARIISATRYSWLGLKAAWRHEAAFRQEATIAIVGLPLAILLARDAVEFLLLVMPIFILILTELVNSAIEAAIDRFGGEHHELSGRAKDMGSAAVLMAIILTCISWITILGNIYL
ncbi:MAG: diacylglycerol kinase [Pseudomonadales bacterium]|jgi:diacylglycerol kinase (ATP)|nr:diacylglycerol kinase [Pseudomonadales bacterium]